MKQIIIKYKELMELQRQGEDRVYTYLNEIGFDTNRHIKFEDNVLEKEYTVTQKD